MQVHGIETNMLTTEECYLAKSFSVKSHGSFSV